MAAAVLFCISRLAACLPLPQMMQQSGRAATCLGFPQEVAPEDRVDLQRRREIAGEEAASTSGAPTFRFYCLGYSVHNVPGQAAAGGANASAAAEASASLPYCEGIEVLVLGATDDTRRAATDRDASGAAAARPASGARPISPPLAPPPPVTGPAQPSSSAGGAADSASNDALRAAAARNAEMAEQLKKLNDEANRLAERRRAAELAERLAKFSETYNRIAERHVAKMKSSLEAIGAALARVLGRSE